MWTLCIVPGPFHAAHASSGSPVTQEQGEVMLGDAGAFYSDGEPGQGRLCLCVFLLMLNILDDLKKR